MAAVRRAYADDVDRGAAVPGRRRAARHRDHRQPALRRGGVGTGEHHSSHSEPWPAGRAGADRRHRPAGRGDHGDCLRAAADHQKHLRRHERHRSDGAEGRPRHRHVRRADTGPYPAAAGGPLHHGRRAHLRGDRSRHRDHRRVRRSRRLGVDDQPRAQLQRREPGATGRHPRVPAGIGARFRAGRGRTGADPRRYQAGREDTPTGPARTTGPVYGCRLGGGARAGRSGGVEPGVGGAPRCQRHGGGRRREFH